MGTYFLSFWTISTIDRRFEVFIPADFVGWASACFLVVFNVSSFFGDSVAIALESSNRSGVRSSLSVLVSLYRSAFRLALILLRIASFAEKVVSCSTRFPIAQSSSSDGMASSIFKLPSRNSSASSSIFRASFRCFSSCFRRNSFFLLPFIWFVPSEVTFWKYIWSSSFSIGFRLRFPERR